MAAAFLAALALLTGQSAPAAAAQPGRPSDLSPVIVTAPNAAARPTQQAARDFVYGVSAPTPGHDQLARFDDPICVDVEGVDAPYDAVVADDIVRIARDAGAKVDGPKCTPNLLVLFTQDVDRLMASLYEKRWDILEGASVSEPAVKRFVETRRPIAWWRVTDVRSWANHPPTNAGDPDNPPTYADARGSHIQSNVIEHLERVVFVVDGSKVEGLSLGQIADYVAFAALADANPDRRPGAPSILGLFDTPPDAATAKLRLTRWDAAFLKAFYLSFSDRASSLQEEQIAGEMRRLLVEPGSPKPAR